MRFNVSILNVAFHPSMSTTNMITTTAARIPRALALRSIRLRTLSSTPCRYNSGNGATKDPSHPNLYYHPSGRSTILSFLPNTPVQGSSTILGSLPEGGELGDFKEEPKFLQVFPFLSNIELIGRKVLHSTIKEGLRLGKGETVEFEAATRPSDGYIHITGESDPKERS